MANVTITQLSAAGPIQGNELVPDRKSVLEGMLSPEQNIENPENNGNLDGLEIQP